MCLTSQQSLQLSIHSFKYKRNLANENMNDANENMNDAQALPIGQRQNTHLGSIHNTDGKQQVNNNNKRRMLKLTILQVNQTEQGSILPHLRLAKY